MRIIFSNPDESSLILIQLILSASLSNSKQKISVSEITNVDGSMSSKVMKNRDIFGSNDGYDEYIMEIVMIYNRPYTVQYTQFRVFPSALLEREKLL